MNRIIKYFLIIIFFISIKGCAFFATLPIDHQTENHKRKKIDTRYTRCYYGNVLIYDEKMDNIKNSKYPFIYSNRERHLTRDGISLGCRFPIDF